jgi:NADH dehydrogenase [ubiquinone] 1 alpha subcomplex assembly factor 1
MAASALKQYLERSVGMLRRNTAKGKPTNLSASAAGGLAWPVADFAVIRMDLSPLPPPITIFSLNSDHPPVWPPRSFALGSDADIGGLSTAALTPVPNAKLTSSPPSTDPAFDTDPEAPSDRELAVVNQSHLAFHGNLSLAVPAAYQGRIRTGYAAFRNRTRPSLFGEETWDLSLYSHLKIVVGYRGWEGWRNKWVINIQTDGPVR